jgi:hypothetical protein
MSLKISDGFSPLSRRAWRTEPLRKSLRLGGKIPEQHKIKILSKPKLF